MTPRTGAPLEQASEHDLPCMREALRLAAHKLPIKTQIIARPVLGVPAESTEEVGE